VGGGVVVGGCEMLTVDPLAVIATVVALGPAPSGVSIKTAEAVLAVLFETVRFAVATTPSAIAVRFNPESTHSYWPVERAEHCRVFDADEADGPIDMLILEKSPTE